MSTPDRQPDLELLEDTAVHPEGPETSEPSSLDKYQESIGKAEHLIAEGRLSDALIVSGDACLALDSRADEHDQIARMHLAAGLEFHQGIRDRINADRAA